MALPTTRDYTITPAGQVPGALLNTLQDMVIGNKHPTLTIPIPGDAFKQRNTGSTVTLSVGSTLLSNGASACDTIAGLILPVGKRIIAVRFYVQDNVTGATKWTVGFSRSTLYDAALTNLGSVISAGTGANQTLTPAIAPIITVGVGVRYMLSAVMTTGTAACKLYGAEVDIDAL